jgi:ABC-2 type transport system ATP-binding protein
MSSALTIENIEKTYATGTHALKGFSFEVKKGEFFALLGPNGSGKTTLINILAGSTKKTAGKINVYGQDIDTHRAETQMKLGIVPQEVSFDSFFTVNEVLELQLGYYGLKKNPAKIDDILENLNLHDKKNTNTRALSGGMKRRLLIAKALVHDPEVLVLDEPTAGVDIELRHSLWKYIRELNRQGKTILLTTHYLEEAETLCERTAIINLGELVACDNTKKLIRSMGNGKTMTLNFSQEVQLVPDELAGFNPQIINSFEIAISFDAAKLSDVFRALEKLKIKPQDIDLKGQKLEDVFMKLTHKQ